MVPSTDVIKGKPNQAQTELKSNKLIMGGTISEPEGEMRTERKLQTFVTSAVKVIITLTAVDINSS